MTKNGFKTHAGELLQRNANFVTGFAVLLVLIAGVGIIRNDAHWWESSLALFGVGLVVFLYLNLRVFVKATVATAVAIITANLALQGGVLFDSRSAVGLVWMSGQAFLFFALIALSYTMTGYRSRWTATALALVVALATTAAFSALLPLIAAIGVALGIAFAVFIGYYTGVGLLLRRARSMPENIYINEHESILQAHGQRENWQLRTLSRRNHISYLIWNHQHAYVLCPVKLAQPFATAKHRRHLRLEYRGVSINNWLIGLNGSELPLWRTGNASMMLVLLDVDNANGSKAQTIGVSLPDTMGKIPVGIYPGKNLLTLPRGSKSKHILEDIDRKFAPFVQTLSEKQMRAMEEIGLTKESSYLNEV